MRATGSRELRNFFKLSNMARRLRRAGRTSVHRTRWGCNQVVHTHARTHIHTHARARTYARESNSVSVMMDQSVARLSVPLLRTVVHLRTHVHVSYLRYTAYATPECTMYTHAIDNVKQIHVSRLRRIVSPVHRPVFFRRAVKFLLILLNG